MNEQGLRKWLRHRLIMKFIRPLGQSCKQSCCCPCNRLVGVDPIKRRHSFTKLSFLYGGRHAHTLTDMAIISREGLFKQGLMQPGKNKKLRCWDVAARCVRSTNHSGRSASEHCGNHWVNNKRLRGTANILRTTESKTNTHNLKSFFSYVCKEQQSRSSRRCLVNKR